MTKGKIISRFAVFGLFAVTAGFGVTAWSRISAEDEAPDRVPARLDPPAFLAEGGAADPVLQAHVAWARQLAGIAETGLIDRAEELTSGILVEEVTDPVTGKTSLALRTDPRNYRNMMVEGREHTPEEIRRRSLPNPHPLPWALYDLRENPEPAGDLERPTRLPARMWILSDLDRREEWADPLRTRIEADLYGRLVEKMDAGQGNELVFHDEENGKLYYLKGLRADHNCLACHGGREDDIFGDTKDGLDAYGDPMDGLKAKARIGVLFVEITLNLSDE